MWHAFTLLAAGFALIGLSGTASACVAPRPPFSQVPPDSIATVYVEILEDVQLPAMPAQMAIGEGHARVRIDRLLSGRAEQGAIVSMRFLYACGPGGPPLRRGEKLILYLTAPDFASWWPSPEQAARFDPKVANAFGGAKP